MEDNKINKIYSTMRKTFSRIKKSARNKPKYSIKGRAVKRPS